MMPGQLPIREGAGAQAVDQHDRLAGPLNDVVDLDALGVEGVDGRLGGGGRATIGRRASTGHEFRSVHGCLLRDQAGRGLWLYEVLWAYRTYTDFGALGSP